MIADAVARLLEQPLRARDNGPDVLDAIVLLGAPLLADGTLTAPLRERVRVAAELHRSGAAPLVVATGGTTRGAPRAEADAMAEGLYEAGVPRDGVIVERASRTTRDNARLTRELIAGRRVWLVTQPFHGKRAARIFRDAGFEPHVWHIDDSIQYRDRARAVRWLVREYGSWLRLLLRRSI